MKQTSATIIDSALYVRVPEQQRPEVMLKRMLVRAGMATSTEKKVKDLTLVFCRRKNLDGDGNDILLGLKKRGFGMGKWNGESRRKYRRTEFFAGTSVCIAVIAPTSTYYVIKLHKV